MTVTTQWEAVLTVPVDEGRDHIQGPASAPVTLVQYGDYECPYCGAAYPIIKDLQARMEDRLRFVFRNFRITTSHPHAEQAAEAAEAATAQGRFWEMHDLLYENQKHLLDRDLHTYAEQLGLDAELFDKELAGACPCRPGPRGLHEWRAQRCERHPDLLHQWEEARRLVRRRDAARRIGTSCGRALNTAWPGREEGGGVEGDRFEELQRKAAEGLTDEEAAELGRLYAERRGERPEDPGQIKGADAAEEDEESQERRELDAAEQAEADEERERTQATPPGEAREPDYE